MIFHSEPKMQLPTFFQMLTFFQHGAYSHQKPIQQRFCHFSRCPFSNISKLPSNTCKVATTMLHSQTISFFFSSLSQTSFFTHSHLSVPMNHLQNVFRPFFWSFYINFNDNSISVLTLRGFTNPFQNFLQGFVGRILLAFKIKSKRCFYSYFFYWTKKSNSKKKQFTEETELKE